MRTFSGNFNLTANATTGDLDVSVNVVHNGTSPLDMFWEGTTIADTVTSGTTENHTYSGAYSGPVTFRFPTGDWTQTATEIECTGPLGICLDQLPGSCVSFKQTGYQGVYMGGSALPSGLTDIHVESLKSAVDVDRVIQALEDNGASSGTLFLAEQSAGKDLALLNSRSWDTQIEPKIIQRVGKSKSPHTSFVGNKPVHHTDRVRKGTRRPLFNGRCAYLPTTTEYVSVPLRSEFDFGEGDTFTVSTWLRAWGAHGAGCIIGTTDADGPGWELAHYSNQNIGFRWLNSGGTVTYSATSAAQNLHALDEWVHIVGRWDGTNMSVWLNGEDVTDSEVLTGTITDAVKSDQSNMRISQRPDGTYNKARMYLYDTRIFNRGCTDEEIRQIASMQPGDTNVGPTDAIVWFDYEEDPESEVCFNKGTLKELADGEVAATTLSTFRDQTTNTVYSYLNEFGYSESLNRISYLGATAHHAAAISEKVFDGPFRLEFIWADVGAHGEDHIGFTDQADNWNPGSNWQHARRCGYRIHGGDQTWIAYINGTQIANGSIAKGDRVSVERFEDDTVEFRVNDSLQYTTTEAGDHRYIYTNYTSNDGFPADVSERGIRLSDEDLGTYIIGNGADLVDGVLPGTWHPRAADPSNLSQDILGLPIQYTGQAPLDPTIVSPCVEFDEGISYGVAEYNPYSPTKTVSFWFRVTAVPSTANRGFIGNWLGTGDQRSWLLTMETAGHVRAYKSVGGVTSSYTTIQTNYADSQWHHCSAVFSTAGTAEIYIDGVIPVKNKNTVGSVAGDLFDSSAVLQVARYNEDAARILGCQISDVIIHGDVLTQDEIVRIMSGDYSVDKEVLVHWNMSDGETDYCFDRSGNRCPLKLNGTVSTLRDATQDVSDAAITSGYALGTMYDQASYYKSTARISSGAEDYFACQARLFCVNTAQSFSVAFGEDKSSVRRWNVHINDSTSRVELSIYDGLVAQYVWEIVEPIRYNQWDTYTFCIDTVADTVFAYRNGDPMTVSQTTGSGVPQIPDNAAEFFVGAYGQASPLHWTGGISQIVWEYGTTWSDNEVKQLVEAGTTDEVKAIRPNAYYIPDGNGTETAQGTPEFNIEAGTPVPVVLPVNPIPVSTSRPETWTEYNGTDQFWDRGPLVSGSQSSGFAWIYMDDFSADAVILAEWEYVNNERSHALFVPTTGLLTFRISPDGTGTGMVDVTYDISSYRERWVSVGYSFSGGNVKLYVNGSEVVSSSIAITTQRGSTEFAIGCSSATVTPVSFFDGKLSKIAYQGVAWTAEDFERMHNDGVPPTGAYYWAEGRGINEATGLPNMSKNGRPVLGGIFRPPAIYGPGTPAPGQKRLLLTEPNAPVAAKHSATGYELEYGDLAYEAVFSVNNSWGDLDAIYIGATDDFDYSFEFYPTATGNPWDGMFGQYTLDAPGPNAGRMIVQYENTQSVRLFIGSSPQVSIESADGTAPLNQWHTARVTRVGNLFTLYLNGEVVGTQTESASIEQRITHIGTDTNSANDYQGRLRNLSITNAGTTTKFLTEGIALPGATLTNVTLSSEPAGAISGNQLFQNSDHTANLYAESVSAEMADVLSKYKYS